jgi:hypothetical protein
MKKLLMATPMVPVVITTNEIDLLLILNLTAT